MIITVHEDGKPGKVKYELVKAENRVSVNITMLDETLLKKYGRIMGMDVVPVVNFDANTPEEVNIKAQVLTFLTDNDIVEITSDCDC